jgi:hypothetical protein
MVQTATPGLTASPALIARMGPPAEPNGFLSRALANLRLWRDAFTEAQDMRREAAARHPFIDS